MEGYFKGYVPSTQHQLDRLYGSLTQNQGSHLFGDVAPHLAGTGKGQLSVPYKAVLKFHPTAFGDERQTTNDCTSHGARNAGDISRATECVCNNTIWIARGATEFLYGCRQSAQDAGMSPAVASQTMHDYGILLRQPYPFADLSTYHADVGVRWGGSGPPKEAIEIARQHPCRYIARIKTLEEARDALHNGYGLHLGSNYIVGVIRDAYGIGAYSGPCSHDMCWGACDDTGGEMLFLVLNSWGAWNSGGHPPWGPIPPGSFLIRQALAQQALDMGELWAVGQVDGFPRKFLPDMGITRF